MSNREASGRDYESTGAITSDSLARDSIKAGGGFGANANPDVYDVSGANSTFANTDTANARRLPPADNREDRDGDRFSSTKYPTGRTGEGYGGTTSDQGYRGGSGNLNNQTSSSYDDDDSNTAPTYASTTAGYNTSQGIYQPKGDNLIEDDDAIPPNRSTYTGDVGGSKDPGRLAEQKFQRYNAESGNDAGIPRDMGRVNDGNQYDALNSSERA